MATPKPYAQLKAELAEANRTIRELEAENEDLQEKIDQIAGIAVEDDEEDDQEEEEDGDGDDEDDEGNGEGNESAESTENETIKVRGCALQRWPTGFILSGQDQDN